MSDVGGLQLLPTQKKKLRIGGFAAHNTLLTFGILIALLLGITYGVLQFMVSKTLDDITAVDGELELLHKTRDKELEAQLWDFERQVTVIKSLLASHTIWVDGLRSMQNLIEPRVSFVMLSADAAKRTYSFRAMADSYSTVAKQIASFYRSNAIKLVTLSRVALGRTGRVDFTMELMFQPEYFLLHKSIE